MIAAPIRDEILLRLQRAEREHDVRILLAVESGSRAWGFASPNSDYDVRFIYARRAADYIAVDLEERRDVIEYPIVDEIDLNGWDIRKALRLFWKSNPAFVEWIQSPIVYMKRGAFADGARALLPQVYNRLRGIHHYRSMARTTYRSHLEAAEVPLKKYFYALRPLLAIRWIEAHDAPPPIEFERLLPTLAGQPALLDDIAALLAAKRVALEKGLTPAMPRLNAFIESELERLAQPVADTGDAAGALDALNALLHATLAEPSDSCPPAPAA